MWRRNFLLGAAFALMSAYSTAFAQVGIKINEVAASVDDALAPDGTASDWVELINTTGSPISLANASLTDNPANPRKWIIPAGVSVPANGRLVVLMDPDRPVSTTANGAYLNAGFGLGASGDSVMLFATGVGGAQLDAVTFGVQVTDLTIGRVPDGTGLWVLTASTPEAANTPVTLGSQAGLRINEWLASPPSGEDDWLEIYNPGRAPVALGGLYLTDSPDTIKLLHRIPDLSFIGAEANAFALFFASGETDNADELPFRLSASGEKIGLFTSASVQIDLVEFGQQTANVSEGRIPDGGDAKQKFVNASSPGGSNFLPFPGLVVSEVLTHTDPPLEDAVEFYNTTDAPINIGGWWLSNRRSLLQRYQVPANTMVPPKGYIVFYAKDFNDPALGDLGFGFSSANGDQVYLSQSVNGQLTGYRVSEEFEAADNGVSIGRVETSLTPITGDYKFVALTRRTFGVDNPSSLEEFRTGTGAPNAGPRIGPVVVNEVMYHPPSLDGITDNILDEYIELRNITPNTVPLYDQDHQTNTWRLRDAVSYTFQGTPSIPPFGYALVVAFDPVAQPTIATAFRAKFNVPATVPLYGPYSGSLGNGGDGIELYRPDTPQLPGEPDAGFVPQIRVDKVNYLDAAPWPTSPDGTGHSLQKKNSTAFGNDPINWEGVAPTAGRGNPSEIADTDLDGMPDAYEDANGFQKNDGSDAGQDADSDGFTNLQEYVAGTNPRDNTSFLSVSAISNDFGTGGTTVKVRFNAVAGKSYTVQYRNSFGPADVWRTLLDIDPPASSGPIEVSDVEAAGRTDRYYRVVTPASDD